MSTTEPNLQERPSHDDDVWYPPSDASEADLDEEIVGPDAEESLAIIILGASGDLAKKKTFASLLDLYSAG